MNALELQQNFKIKMSNFLPKDITFVITTFKSERIIDSCIDSLPKESQKIIIENGSNHEFKNFIEHKYENLKCYVMENNLGYGCANNFGIKKSKTRYIFILNPDARLSLNTISDMSKALKNLNFAISAPYSKSDFNSEIFNNQNIIEQETVKGFAMLIDKNEMNQIGYFDENFFIYLEEIDLCKRVIQKNKKIFLINTIINHESGFSHGDREDIEMEKSRNWHWMWSKFYYNKKYYGYFRALIITLPNFITSGFKFLFYTILNNSKKKIIYRMRFKGLLNSYFLSKSFYRPYE